MAAQLTLEEAAELLGMSTFELKISRQKGLPPGSLGRVEAGRLIFNREDLLGEPRTKLGEIKIEEDLEEETAEELEQPEERISDPGPAYEPIEQGAGWYLLSDGSKIRGREAAYKAQLKIEG